MNKIELNDEEKSIIYRCIDERIMSLQRTLTLSSDKIYKKGLKEEKNKLIQLIEKFEK